MLSPETLEWLRQTARQGHSYSLAHLDHVERLDALCESLVTAMKRIAALESFFERAEAAVDPLLAGGPLPAGAAWIEREGVEVFTARPAPCSAAEAGEPDDDEPQTLHSVALKMLDTLARLGVLPEILDTLRRAIREPMEPAPAAAAAPVATDNGLLRCYAQAVEDALRRFADNDEIKAAGRRALYNLGREHGGASQASCPHIRSSDEGTSYCALAQQVAAAPEPIEPDAQPAGDAAPVGRNGPMAEPPSPVAQAVLNAAYKRMDDNPHNEVEATLAAAIRALVEQTVPPCSPLSESGTKQLLVRHAQLAIAAELDQHKADAESLSPKEVEAQQAFTEMRDEILNLSDGLEVNEVLRIIDNHTPEWV
jgi:hypothetical protein